ncbi:MAG: right-handed parallel beta-helix repeat-containing protein [Alistipes sp.]|nr:right-handed parallel beta-helix repeat-containing protein [Candidatus Alistipes equi]
MKKKISLLVYLMICLSFVSWGKDVNIKNFGAKADGKTKNTAAIQKAIDTVSKAGGGRVTISGGIYLTAPIKLQSGVELFIDADATLLASPDLEDYPERKDVVHCSNDLPRFRNVALIYADEAHNIAISGRGTIDCNGHLFVKEKTGNEWRGMRFERTVSPEKTVARVVFFAGCSNVTVTDIKMVNQPAGWSYWINDCDFVIFDRCKILARVDYPNNDGIHINSSRNVTISNCLIETGDDSIVIRANNRTLKQIKICEHIVVTNCTLRSWCNAIRIGWTNDGTIRECLFSNLSIYDSSNGIAMEFPKKHPKNDFGCEASLVENMTFSNITMSGLTSAPIFISVSSTDDVMFNSVRNIRFNEVHCAARKLPYINGLKDHPIEDVTFSNCSFTKVDEKELPDWRRHGLGSSEKAPTRLVMENTRRVSFNNTTFNENF